jgi:hypothetical protein
MNPPPRLTTLDAIESALWNELARAPNDRHHEWRTPVLATRDGDSVDARTVVLREVDPQARELVVYTDARSPKARQVRAHPAGTLLCWSKRLSWQLRLRVALSVEEDGLAATSRWAKLMHSPAAQDYLSPLPPGTPLAEAPTRAPAERHFFAVLTLRVLAIDWLELHAEGHRRAAFGDGPAHWLAP